MHWIATPKGRSWHKGWWIQSRSSMAQTGRLRYHDWIMSKGFTKKMGFNPMEIGMSKLKGMALCNINGATKEGTLSYLQFCQLLIEYYSNILYMSDTLNAYAHLVQGESKLITKYLTRAKALLEHIHHSSKICNIPGISYDKLYLVWGLHSPHIWQRVASEQDIWYSMEDIFQTIEHVTRSVEWNRAFLNPNLET